MLRESLGHMSSTNDPAYNPNLSFDREHTSSGSRRRRARRSRRRESTWSTAVSRTARLVLSSTHDKQGTALVRTIAIGIVCKTPAAGFSKTRLSPPLRPDECAVLSACFIRDWPPRSMS
jgi:hypothetical protein